MINQMNKEFFEKMETALKLEKEALMMLFPEKIGAHLDVIGKEAKALLVDILLDACSDNAGDNHGDDTSQSSKIKKVDIE